MDFSEGIKTFDTLLHEISEKKELGIRCRDLALGSNHG